MNEIPSTASIISRLVPDEMSRGIAGVHFDLVPEGELSEFLRDRDRPDDLYGFRLEYSGVEDSQAVRLVAMGRTTQLYPHTHIRRAGVFDRFRRNRVRSGDPLFDRRWIITSEDPAFAEGLTTASMRTWLMSIASDHSMVQFEINLRFAVAVDDARRIARLPSLIQIAHEFVEHLPRWTQ